MSFCGYVNYISLKNEATTIKYQDDDTVYTRTQWCEGLEHPLFLGQKKKSFFGLNTINQRIVLRRKHGFA